MSAVRGSLPNQSKRGIAVRSRNGRLSEVYRRSGLLISREQGMRYDAGFVMPILWCQCRLRYIAGFVGMGNCGSAVAGRAGWVVARAVRERVCMNFSTLCVCPLLRKC